MNLSYLSPISATPVQSGAVTLTDLSGQGSIDIRGRDPSGIFQELRIGDVKIVDYGVLVRLTPDQWIFLANSNIDTAFEWLQMEVKNPRVVITDVTHGYGHIRLMGQRARDVLPKICGLDFADSTFPDHHVAQSSLAKVRTLIVRLDDSNSPAYHLIVSSSLAAYVWSVVADAMQEFSK
jgi:heterotetrameric sarcosine oxidase gamma subunit